jgi:hypothetical protein
VVAAAVVVIGFFIMFVLPAVALAAFVFALWWAWTRQRAWAQSPEAAKHDAASTSWTRVPAHISEITFLKSPLLIRSYDRRKRSGRLVRTYETRQPVSLEIEFYVGSSLHRLRKEVSVPKDRKAQFAAGQTVEVLVNPTDETDIYIGSA